MLKALHTEACWLDPQEDQESSYQPEAVEDTVISLDIKIHIGLKQTKAGHS